jgi:heptosyltransferase-2
MAHSQTPAAGKRLLLAALDAFFGRANRKALHGSAVNSGEAPRILVVELWNIGDVVLTIPFLAQLRSMFPRAQITLLARPHARMILDGTGLVDEFVSDPSPADNWLSLNPLAQGWRDLWRLRNELSARNFDLAFQSRLHLREHVILAMSGARRRIGYAFGKGDSLLTDALPAGDSHLHKAEAWLRLLDVVGGPAETASCRLHVSEAERVWASRFLEERGVGRGDVVIGIHPGASLPEKRWPIDRFAEIASDLAARPGVRVVALVDPAGYGDSLGAIDGVITAQVGLRELMALIERCALLACNDSGPMHLAGALGVPTVAVFGNGIARSFAPLGALHEIVSGSTTEKQGDPERAGELENIPASRVLDAVNRFLGTWSFDDATPAPGRSRS